MSDIELVISCLRNHFLKIGLGVEESRKKAKEVFAMAVNGKNDCPSIYVYHDADNLKSAIDHPSMHSVVFSTKRLAGLRNETKLYER